MAVDPFSEVLGGGAQPDPFDEVLSGKKPGKAPSYAESFARGGVQGATAGTSDEIAGAAKAIGVESVEFAKALAGGPASLGSYIGSKLGVTFGDKKAGEVVDTYRTGRDEERAKNKAAEKANPKTYMGAKIGGGIVAGAPIAAPASVLGMTAAGAGFGGATALGESEADLTKGEIGQAAKDTGVGIGVGAAAGLATAGLARGAREVYRAVKGTRGVERVAAEVADGAAAAKPVQGQPTARTFYEKSREIAGDAGNDIFSPAEMTGDPAASLAESLALQKPKTMRTAQAQRSSRLQNTARYLDGLVDRVAANPEKLGRADVAESFSGAVERHLQSLKQARSAAARPLYDKAEKLLGSKHVAPIDEVAAFVSTELERAVGPFQPSAAPLKQTLDVLQQGSKNGFANIKTVRALAEKWGQQADGTGDLLKDLPIAQRKYVASKMAELLNRSIDAAAESGQKTDAGIDALREAQRTWAQHSRAIEELPTEALSKIMKVGGGEASDTMLDRMMAMSPEQLGGVMRVVNKTDPAAAQQLRAQVMETLLVRAGKPERGASIAAEIGATELRPGQALALLGKNEAKLRALYTGDDKAMFALRRVMETLKRKSQGPGLRGSQSVPLLAQLGEEAAESVAEKTTPGGGFVVRTLKSMFGTDAAVADAVTDPAKLKLLDEALQISLGITRGSRIPDATMRAFIASANRLGITAAERNGLIGAPRTETRSTRLARNQGE